MTWKLRIAGGLASLLGGTLAAQPPTTSPPPPPLIAPARPPDAINFPGPTQPYGTNLGGPFSIDSESLPAMIGEDIARPPAPPSDTPRLGPTPVSDVRLLMDGLGLADLLGDSGIRAFGWAEAGYTSSSTGSGLLATQPRQNRFGNELLFNQFGLVIQKPLQQDRFDIGFNVRYFAGADAALGQPLGGIDDPPGNPRFSHDFRDLYLSAHLPILTEGGVDVKAGRMNTIIGYNGFLAPYRPFYSSDYQFFYSQDGAFTGILADFHLTKQLDVWSGVTLGANTFFTKRSEDSYCYIGQVNYALTEERNTILTGSVYCGRDAIFAAPGLNGDFVTMVELRVQHRWNERFTQIVQSNMGWDTNTAVGTGEWYGVYTIGILHLNECWDVLGRAEWFRDVRGTRTGIDTSFAELTFGVNYHPTPWLEVRPEIRGDFAGEPAFGNNNTPRERNQLTCGVSALLKF
jgi:hypothetical protein